MLLDMLHPIHERLLTHIQQLVAPSDVQCAQFKVHAVICERCKLQLVVLFEQISQQLHQLVQLLLVGAAAPAGKQLCQLFFFWAAAAAAGKGGAEGGIIEHNIRARTRVAQVVENLRSKCVSCVQLLCASTAAARHVH